MKKTCKQRGILFAVLLGVLFCSCKKKEKDPFAEEKGTYFSIHQFALDEWNTFAGQPFSIVKTVRVNGGKIDSSYTNSDTLNWSEIFKVFFATEISDRKYLGQYTFSQFDDNADETHNFFYEAKDEDLYTQKLLITIAQFTNKVKGIYVETRKSSLFSEYTQKLYYKPLKTIQIQTIEKPFMGEKKHTVVEYDFMR